jgi:cytoskeletal protein CcmA (bactofilin family)
MSLWQKTDTDRPAQAASPEVSAGPRPSANAPARESRGDRMVNIGQSIEIKGELTGNEDLIIDGRVEGKIDLKDHNLTIGKNGRIKATIHANSVSVHGEVVGDINADDKVEIAPSGSVQGDLCAPRVALADGSSFKGSIDMGRQQGAAAANPPARSTREMPLAVKA